VPALRRAPGARSLSAVFAGHFAVTQLKAAISSLAALAWSAWVPGLAAADQADDVLSVLRSQKPNVKWRKPVVRADVTGDGAHDLAVLGSTGRALLVTVVLGPIQSGSEMVTSSLPVGEGGVDVACAARATLAVERAVLPEHARRPASASTEGLRLSQGSCDVVHMYWDREARSLSWWVEP
jgi:hypothetical protein